MSLQNLPTIKTLTDLHQLRLSTPLPLPLFLHLLTLYAHLSTPLQTLRFLTSTNPTPSLSLLNLSLRAVSRTPSAFLLYCFLTRNLRPNHLTFPSLIVTSTHLRLFLTGLEIHCRTAKCGILGDGYVSNSLIDFYSKMGRIWEAKRVFEEVGLRDVVGGNALLGGFGRLGIGMGVAREVFEGMGERNLVSWNAMLVGYVNSGDLVEARKVFEGMPERNLVSWNTMVGGLFRGGMVEEGRRLFEEMPERNLVSWAVAINGYARSGRACEAVGLFEKMVDQEGLRPDAAVMIGVISACGQLGDCQLAGWIGGYVDRVGIERNERILTSLVDMHAKCGNLEEACRIFEEIRVKDVCSYTAIVNGLASHGYGVEALEVFRKMTLEGVEPDRITFIGVLNACRHAGLVKEGLRVWNLMVNSYKMMPDSDHYACIIDMFGRAGRLNEAYELVRSMPSGMNVEALGSVLAACKNHGEIPTAEAIAKELFELEPENTGNYMLLWGLYAEKGQWNKAATLRHLMAKKGMKKMPGYSLV